MNLIPNDYSRCSNAKCVKKTICKRFLQNKIDQESKTEKRVSTCEFKSENCEKIIRVWKPKLKNALPYGLCIELLTSAQKVNLKKSLHLL